MIDPPKTLVELLRYRSAQDEAPLAYAFLDDGGMEGERLTYAELDEEARRIAGGLQLVHSPGDRALLLFPAGLDFLKAFFGCLYAGLIAIPSPPPEVSRLKRTMPRLRAIAKDAQVSVVLSTTGTLSLVAEACRDLPEFQSLQFLDITTIPATRAASWRDPGTNADDLAYLQYTSGSTTSPKGVMLTHRNVMHHCRDVRAACEYGTTSVSVTWLPYFHDYGLIEGLMVPLQNGTSCYVMSPFAFLKRPFSWLQSISRHRATHTQAPNFAYAQCSRRIKPEQLSQLDLSCLRSAGNGAEPINPDVLEGFHNKFAPQGFRWETFCPAYGLAEATLMVSCCSPSTPPHIGSFLADALGDRRVVESSDGGAAVRRVTSCGPVLGQINVVIVDPETRVRCSEDEVGEIWVADPSVSQGYWRSEEETERTFRAFLAATGEGPFLRTGDLGFLLDGELYITSRIKDLIIVAGTNHYPQDIEWTVEKCHPAIRPNHVAALGVMVDGEERLLVAAELERGSIPDPGDFTEVVNAVRKAIAEGHEMQVHEVRLLNRGSLPKTASGKIQRHACGHFHDENSPDLLASWVADQHRAVRT